MTLDEFLDDDDDQWPTNDKPVVLPPASERKLWTDHVVTILDDVGILHSSTPIWVRLQTNNEISVGEMFSVPTNERTRIMIIDAKNGLYLIQPIDITPGESAVINLKKNSTWKIVDEPVPREEKKAT